MWRSNVEKRVFLINRSFLFDLKRIPVSSRVEIVTSEIIMRGMAMKGWERLL